MRILLSAYLDNNLGDDLFVDLFAEHYRAHDIRLICEGPVELNVQLRQRANLTRVGLKQALRQLHRIDALVIIGGSIFQDNPEYYKYDFRRNALVTLARLLGKAVFIIGCNIGPIRSPRGARYSRYCFALANAISVRDSASFAQLQAWKCRTPYRLGADLIFSYPLPARGRSACGAQRLGISVVNVAGSSAQTAAYIDKLSELAAAHLARDPANEVTLLAFNGGGSGQNDSVPCAAIAARLSPQRERVSVLEYRPRLAINEFLRGLARCDYLIGSRFHAVVLALGFGIPFLPIAYSDKTLNLLHDIDYPQPVTEYGTMPSLDVDAVLADVARSQPALRLPRPYLDSSRNHFVALDDFVARAAPRITPGAPASQEAE